MLLSFSSGLWLAAGSGFNAVPIGPWAAIFLGRIGVLSGLLGLDRLFDRRRQYNAQEAALHAGRLLPRRSLAETGQRAVEDLLTDLGMGHLASAEHHRQLHLIAFGEEALNGAHLQVDIVLSGTRAQAHFVHHRAALVLARVPLLLGLLVFPLSVVEQSTDWGIAVRVDLDEVEAGFAGTRHRVRKRNYSYILPVCAYETDLSRSDPFINPELSENKSGPLG